MSPKLAGVAKPTPDGPQPQKADPAMENALASQETGQNQRGGSKKTSIIMKDRSRILNTESEVDTPIKQLEESSFHGQKVSNPPAQQQINVITTFQIGAEPSMLQ